VAYRRHPVDRGFALSAVSNDHPQNTSNTPEAPLERPPGSLAGSALPFFLALLVAFGLAYGGWTLWRVRQFEASRGDAIPDIGPPLTEFELTERSGKPFRSEEMLGKVWVATYFFTTCPGNCIRLNQNIQHMNALPELKDVTWVSITCDPDTDTLEALSKYADSLKADPDRWLFVRGDLNYTQRVARGMNLYLSRKGHQDYAVVIDKSGKIRGMFDATSLSDSERLKKLLVKCLQEDPPQASTTSRPAPKAPSPSGRGLG
jgi:cytochrome oxidase Cu insertion factor (SCO1/SenC/PrrC family)